MKKSILSVFVVFFCLNFGITQNFGDPSFLFLSGSQTFLPERRPVNLFMSFKFNYMNHIEITPPSAPGLEPETTYKSSYFFTYINGELNIHDKSFSNIVSSGVVNFNSYLIFPQKDANGNRLKRQITDLFKEESRLPFAGFGTKIFQGKGFFGAHLGSAEIGSEKLFLNSYFWGGYYAPLSTQDTRFSNIFVEADIGISPKYLEKNVNIGGNKSLETLTRLLLSTRLKVEILQPLGNELLWKETDMRITAHIPFLYLIHY